MTKAMTRIEKGRDWLRKVRGDDDLAQKRAFLTEQGYTGEELDELFEWEKHEVAEGVPLFA